MPQYVSAVSNYVFEQAHYYIYYHKQIRVNPKNITLKSSVKNCLNTKSPVYKLRYPNLIMLLILCKELLQSVSVVAGKNLLRIIVGQTWVCTKFYCNNIRFYVVDLPSGYNAYRLPYLAKSLKIKRVLKAEIKASSFTKGKGILWNYHKPTSL